jgi:cytochrome c
MRKVLLMMAFSPLFFACGSGEGEKKAEEKKDEPAKTEAPKPLASQEELDKGLEMIGKLDCTACHAIDKAVLGPSYIDVAKKYEPTEANVDSLSVKVIKGGAGIWGNVQQMTPHPSLSMDSARTMVRYILSLRNRQ